MWIPTMRKFDLVIIGAILLVAAGAFFINRPDSDGGHSVSVVSERAETLFMTLPDTPLIINLENRYGRNTLRLTHDGAEVIWASCPTQICVHTGKIKNSRQMIACLPHYLIITLEGEDHGADVDAIAR